MKNDKHTYLPRWMLHLSPATSRTELRDQRPLIARFSVFRDLVTVSRRLSALHLQHTLGSALRG